MRKSQSLFNYVCVFVNTIPIGEEFTSKQFITAVGSKENSTRWKRINGDNHYNCHQYKGYLRKTGFIKNVKHGTWRVERHIPAWFTLGHLQFILGYLRTHKYNGMTINEIRGLLKTSAAPIISKKVDNISQNPSPSNVTTGSSPKSVNNMAKKILTNSTYGYKIENHPIMKTAASEKIDYKDSAFFNEPSLSTGDQKIDIAVNIGVLESAKATLSQFTSNDTFERARVYNVMGQIEHISKELQDKLNLLSAKN